MDGVIADFEKGILEIYRKLYPDKPYIPLEQRTTFYVEDQYPQESRPLLQKIYLSEGFYRNLPVVEGSLEALEEMAAMADVYVCTSPLLSNPYCIKEKYEWISDYLGSQWLKKIIVSYDKTLIRGDILIDDKPQINGIELPEWEHVLYSRPYNRHIRNKRRITWQNWESVLFKE